MECYELKPTPLALSFQCNQPGPAGCRDIINDCDYEYYYLD